MVASYPSHERGQRIRSTREAKGLSQADLGRAIGVSQPAIKKIEAGQTLKSRYLHDIEQFLGIATPAPAGARPSAVENERVLPVYSAVEGGSGEMVISTDPIDEVPRPWYLKGIKNGYAVVVVGESMAPAFEPGDIVVVNPRAPAVREKHAIFVGGEEQGEFRAAIKRLIRSTDKVWRVRQYNPEKEFDLSKKDWPRALRVVGKYEGG
jgi:phage repressor protein C with HTH and peptisase S24 domain